MAQLKNQIITAQLRIKESHGTIKESKNHMAQLKNQRITAQLKNQRISRHN